MHSRVFLALKCVSYLAIISRPEKQKTHALVAAKTLSYCKSINIQFKLVNGRERNPVPAGNPQDTDLFGLQET
jgi:hypothetical protein